MAGGFRLAHRYSMVLRAGQRDHGQCRYLRHIEALGHSCSGGLRSDHALGERLGREPQNAIARSQSRDLVSDLDDLAQSVAPKNRRELQLQRRSASVTRQQLPIERIDARRVNLNHDIGRPDEVNFRIRFNRQGPTAVDVKMGRTTGPGRWAAGLAVDCHRAKHEPQWQLPAVLGEKPAGLLSAHKLLDGSRPTPAIRCVVSTSDNCSLGRQDWTASMNVGSALPIRRTG